MIRTTALVTAALLLACAVAFAQPKSLSDFRGMKFGQTLDQFEHMAPLDKGNDLKFYKKYRDDNTFQGVPVKDLSYGFYKGKFCVVLFTASGPTAYNTIKANMDAAYGQPSQATKNIKQFTYPLGEVSVELNYDDTKKVVAVQYAYMPVYKQMLSDVAAGKARP